MFINSLAGQLDFEDVSRYALNITSHDDGVPSLSVTQVVNLFITDEQEPPIVSIEYDELPIKNDALMGTRVGHIIASDPDFNQTLTYYLFNTYMGIFQLANTTIYLATDLKDLIDDTMNVTIDVRVNDDGDPSLSTYCHSYITITDGNHPPTDIILSRNTLDEAVDNSNNDCDVRSYATDSDLKDYNESLAYVTVIDEDVSDVHIISVISSQYIAQGRHVSKFLIDRQCYFFIDSPNILKVSYI